MIGDMNKTNMGIRNQGTTQIRRISRQSNLG
jgi:hypothetical protein